MSICLHLVALGGNEPFLNPSPKTRPIQSCFRNHPQLGRGCPVLSLEDHLEANLFSCQSKKKKKKTQSLKGGLPSSTLSLSCERRGVSKQMSAWNIDSDIFVLLLLLVPGHLAKVLRGFDFLHVRENRWAFWQSILSRLTVLWIDV